MTREQAIWEQGFLAGQEDIGGIVIACLIEDGRTMIGLNELRDLLATIITPSQPVPELVMEMLEAFKTERRTMHISRHNGLAKPKTD
jgi:hypothetical protein